MKKRSAMILDIIKTYAAYSNNPLWLDIIILDFNRSIFGTSDVEKVSKWIKKEEVKKYMVLK